VFRAAAGVLGGNQLKVIVDGELVDRGNDMPVTSALTPRNEVGSGSAWAKTVFLCETWRLPLAIFAVLPDSLRLTAKYAKIFAKSAKGN
jgi:hypothetical protein